MGSLLSGPSVPGPDPELVRQREEAEAKAKAEQAEQERLAAELERKKRANLLGKKSLQSEEIEGFTGFKKMGTAKPVDITKGIEQ